MRGRQQRGRRQHFWCVFVAVHERTSSGTDTDAAAVSAGARPPGGSILYPSSAVSDGQSASRGSKRRSNGGSGVAHAPLGPGERARPVSTCPSPDAEKRRFQCRYCDYRTAKRCATLLGRGVCARACRSMAGAVSVGAVAR